MSNPRGVIANILRTVIAERVNLDTAFSRHLNTTNSDSAFIKAACFGVLRHLLRLDKYLKLLLDKPLKAKDLDIQCLLLCGLYELFEMHTPDHAVVSQSVHATSLLNKSWAEGLVNAVLRNARRRYTQLQTTASQDPEAANLHPNWLLDALRQDWPDHWKEIVAQNNLPPPMTLRLDLHQLKREQYQQQLHQYNFDATPNRQVASALTLGSAVDVHSLPGFDEGRVSVQDAAAQLAASLLGPQPGECVLDACAAPGGKTLHILQQQPELMSLLALDKEPDRVQRIQQNLTRAKVQAQLQVGDASDPQGWWDGRYFDRILLDAPCSATGVIRRHPDIKLLRRPGDPAQLARTQSQILDALWPLLKTGGMLLYATCSVLKIENEHQIHDFLQRHKDASCAPIEVEWGHPQACGRQILPGENDMDGFYYARLCKQD